MRSTAVTTDVLRRAVARALRAPSVHNTQPWRWRIRHDAVELHADPDRHLAATDPDRRDLVVSCGAALHHLRCALAAEGVATATDRLPDPEDELHLATVRLAPGPPDPCDAELAVAIERRRTDRRPFGPRPVDPAVLVQLARHADALGAALRPVTDAAARGRLADALADAAARQEDEAGYATEIAAWTRRWAAARDGVPATARPGAGPTGGGLRRFPRGRLAGPRWYALPARDAAVLAVLTTPGDGLGDRLRAGEATSAVLLAATASGLASTPLSQAVEVGTVRDRLAAEVLRTPEHPQLVLRVGVPADGAAGPPASPRRLLESVLLRR